MYFICSLVGALARHPARGPYSELTSIFYGIPYSYGRSLVVTAMIATDPGFPDTRAVECLWDCQPEVRELGATHVAIVESSIRSRLNVMATDWAEDADVQLAAQSRLRDHYAGRRLPIPTVAALRHDRAPVQRRRRTLPRTLAVAPRSVGTYARAGHSPETLPRTRASAHSECRSRTRDSGRRTRASPHG